MINPWLRPVFALQLRPPAASSQIRRLFGPRGSAARQDVLVAADLDAASEEEDFAASEEDSASRVAFRKAETEKEKEQGGEENGETGGSKQREGRRTMDTFDRQTGERKRCFT